MCKSCQVLIGCSCYCKDEWHSPIPTNESTREEYCSKCNHTIRSTGM